MRAPGTAASASASGGIGAAVGFSDGSGISEILLERSLQDGISGIVSDHHIWFNRDVAPGSF